MARPDSSSQAESQRADTVRVNVNGVVLVVGLSWRPLLSSRQYLAEAKKLGKELDMEMVSIRKGATLQAGFAPKQADAKGRKALRKMYSFAATVADHLGKVGIGIFALPDGRYAFVAVHKGAILPKHDFVGDRDTVQRKLGVVFGQFASREGEGEVTIIAPPEFGTDSKNIPLDELIDPTKLNPDHRLQPLSFGMTRKELGTVLIGSTAVVALIVGGFAWWTHHQRALEEEADLEASEIQNGMARTAKAQAFAALPRPWQTQPAPGPFITACTQVLHELVGVDVGGWHLKKVTCKVGAGNNRAGDLVEAVYRRPGTTTITEFRNAVTALGTTADVAFVDGEPEGTIRAGLRLTAAGAAVTEKALPHLDASVDAILVRAQSLPPSAGVRAKFQDKKWVAPKGTPEGVAPTWRTVEASLSSAGVAPVYLFDGLPVGGMTLSSITGTLGADGHTLNWEIAGEINGN